MSFPTSFQALIDQIPVALSVYAEGVERFVFVNVHCTQLHIISPVCRLLGIPLNNAAEPSISSVYRLQATPLNTIFEH